MSAHDAMAMPVAAVVGKGCSLQTQSKAEYPISIPQSPLAVGGVDGFGWRLVYQCHGSQASLNQSVVSVLSELAISQLQKLQLSATADWAEGLRRPCHS